jgi:hypothetical protein
MTDTNATQPTVPVVADLSALSETINQMSEDKSNDWTNEIATLADVEKELIAARANLEIYRRHVGGLETIESASRYLAGDDEWNLDDLPWNQVE